MNKLKQLPAGPNADIAIIGMSGRFPGARNIDEFWQNLRNGVDSVINFSDQELEASGIDPANLRNPNYIKAGAILGDVGMFDADFFEITAREAAELDPQHRLLLECAWETLEHAGYSPSSYTGTIGVYAGSRISEYLMCNLPTPDMAGLNVESGSLLTNWKRILDNDNNTLATRIAYKLDLRGQAIAMQTACSTSLVAVHMACQSLLRDDCDIILAGGVCVRVPQKAGYLYSEGMIFSPDGHTRTFDAKGKGTIFSSGVGMIALKRLDRAMADGDCIQAVIRGSAVNNDGDAMKAAFTAPSADGQAEVITKALSASKVDPGSITYVEAHGTATTHGDLAEMSSLTKAFRSGTDMKGFCALGSVKTNIGHPTQAAGIIGLIKTVLMLKHKMLVPHLHFEKPNPHIDFVNSPFYVNTKLTEWKAGNFPRRAGVNSFGVGGTNVHVVLEEAPVDECSRVETDRPTNILCLSAKSKTALKDLVRSYEEFFNTHPETPVENICFTANAGRSHFNNRLTVVAETSETMHAALLSLSAGTEHKAVLRGESVDSNQPVIAFLFTGQGSQYIGMARELYETQPTFRKVLNQCDVLLQPYLEQPLLSVIYPSTDEKSPIDMMAYTQPALFAVEYALAELWRSWGIEPMVVMGHSVGEYVAACVAGVFSLEDGLKLIAARGRLMQELPQDGEMVVVLADLSLVEETVKPYADEVSIAGINGPNDTVISGKGRAVREVLKKLKGVEIRPLKVSHAFHSPLMEPMLEEFKRVASGITYGPPRIKLISNVTGQVVDKDMELDACYWQRHIRKPVLFLKSMETLHKQGCNTCMEIGPHPVLLGMGRSCLPDQIDLWLPSLRRDRKDWPQMLESLSSLYVHGSNIDWLKFDDDYPRRRVTLPTYPFQRQRYWVEAATKVASKPLISTQMEKQNNTLHPLLGVRLLSPLKEVVFESKLSQDSPAFLRDHNIFGNVVFPGAGMVEMALAAAAQQFESGHFGLENVIFHEALILPPEKVRTVQLILTPEGTEGAVFQLFSMTDREEENDDTPWKLHASGKICAEKIGVTMGPCELDTVRKRCANELSVAAKYEWNRKQGKFYGPNFQGIKQLWRGEDEALALVQLPEPLESSAEKFQIHPAFLDACLQVCSVAFLGFGTSDVRNEVYLPMIWERVNYYGGVGKKVWSHASFEPKDGVSNEIQSINLHLFDESGQLIMEVEGLHFKYARREKLSQRDPAGYLNEWLYKIEWQPMALKQLAKRHHGRKGYWLIFADNGGVGDALKQKLEAQGEECLSIFPGTKYRAAEDGQFQINPIQPQNFQRLLRDINKKNNLPCRDVVFLWGLEKVSSEGPDITSLKKSQVHGSAAGLHIVQAVVTMMGGLKAPRLWFVTRGVQRLPSDSDNMAVAQAPLWGLGRSIIHEHPELRCGMIDLDSMQTDNETDALFKEINSDSEENQVLLRHKERYVLRLIPDVNRPEKISEGTELPKNRSFQLTISTPGILDNLTFQEKSRCEPGPDEMEIRVHTTGLNFRDVLSALGKYPGDPGPLGRECSGTIVKLGEEVKGFAVGDKVLAVASGSFSSFVTTKAHCAVQKPGNLSFNDAATIPINFLTAYYGLCHLAKMRAGERVLIHAAAGGVGVAAVQIAQWLGVEVFATASPGKWQFLKSIGVHHIMNSRTLEFADEIIQETDGQGVNIVLNSLTGDFIPKSLSLLTPNGRFVEMGKIGIWKERQVKECKADASYFPFDLGDVTGKDPELTQSMYHAIMEAFENGALKPLPQRVFPIEEVTSAFRYMAQAKHIGKIVVSQEKLINRSVSEISSSVRRDVTYMITGGLGGLGLYLARWLVDQGAQNLVLLGRSGPTDTARKVLDELEGAGARIYVAQADVAKADQITGVLSGISESMPPLRGIFHAAGVLDDGMLLNLTWERFARVLEPKIDGTWNLHTLTQNLPLDFFVLFSSITSIYPGMGRGSYAAANAFLDGVAHYRRTLGLKAVSINWGAWGGAGMAARLEQHLKDRRDARGVGIIEPEQGMQILKQILKRDIPQIAVMPIDWSKYLQEATAKNGPFLSIIMEKKAGLPQKEKKHPSTAQPTLFTGLENASQAERRDLLITHIQQLVSKVLGTSSSELDIEQPFNIMGLDSLMAIELRNRIHTDLKLDLPMVKYLEGPTISQLADLVSKTFKTEEMVELHQAAFHQPIDQAKLDQLRQLLAEWLPKDDILPGAPSSKGHIGPIFILSPPRSGSTLLRIMLAGHPRLFSPPELGLLFFNTLQGRKAAFSDRLKFRLEGTIRAIMALKNCTVEQATQIMAECEDKNLTTQQFYHLMQTWCGEKTLVDKTPSYTQFLDRLKRAETYFDNALYIHLLRHPYGMISSFEETQLAQVFYNFEHPFTTRELGELVWLNCHQNIMTFLQKVPKHRHYQLRFEELVRNPRPTLEGLCYFLGLEFNPEMLQPYKDKKERMTNGITPLSKPLGDGKFDRLHEEIDPAVADRWKNNYQDDFLGDITKKVAETLGYDDFVVNSEDEEGIKQLLDELENMPDKEVRRSLEEEL